MQIVIDVSENLMKYIVNGKDLSEEQNDEMALAIANGTPLPKGHGRLIDADELSVVLDKMAYMDSQPRAIRRCIKRIEKEPTIIEADTESEGKE